MNEQLQSFARQTLKDGLAQLPSEWQRNFKLMYASGSTVEDKLSKDIIDVVNSMPAGQLDWAMQQVQNSLAKIGEQATEQAKEKDGIASEVTENEIRCPGCGRSKIHKMCPA